MEDNIFSGSLSEEINSLLKKKSIEKKILNFTWPNKFIEQGSRDELIQKYELDSDSIFKKIIINIK